MTIKRYTKKGSSITCFDPLNQLNGVSGNIIRDTKTMYWVDFVKPDGYRLQTSVRKDSIIEEMMQ
jgi:hypothetical protein